MINFSNHLVLVAFLLKEITAATDFIGCKNIANDFLIGGMDINTWFNSHDDEPYYVCVRKFSTEMGTLDMVKTRCAALGEPIKVYRITKHGCGEYNVDILNSL